MKKVLCLIGLLSVLGVSNVSAKGSTPDSYKKWKHKELLLQKERNFRYTNVTAYYSDDSCAFAWKTKTGAGVYRFSNHDNRLKRTGNFYMSDVDFVNSFYDFVSHLQQVPNRYEWIQSADFLGVHNKWRGEGKLGLAVLTGFDSFGMFWGMHVSQVIYDHKAGTDVYELTLVYKMSDGGDRHIKFVYEGDEKAAKKETVYAYVRNVGTGEFEKKSEIEIEKDEE